MPAFIVDSHPQRNLIIELLCSGKSARFVGRAVKPPVEFNAIQRYKSLVIKPILARAEEMNKLIIQNSALQPALQNPLPATPQAMSQNATALQATQQAALDAPVLSIFRNRLEKLHGRIDNAIDRAEERPDLFGVLPPLFNQASKNLEMLGRATGELEPQSAGHLSIQIICPVAPADSPPRITYSSDDAIESGSCETIGIIQR